jgi:phage FluMu protein Com
MEKSTVPDTKEKKARHRSPNYPAVSLRDAVDRVRKLYEKDGKAGAPPELAAVHIGFASAHGQAMAALAALKKFGLVETVNGRLAPSQRAIEVLNLPEADLRRLQALKDAALSPAIYSDLAKAYCKTGFPSDDTLQSELVTYKGFNRSAVAGFVKDFKDTLDFAGLSDLPKLKLQIEDRKPQVEIGDYVQWASQGTDQFEKPHKVRALSEDRGFVFVDGSQTGIPIEQVTRCNLPAEEQFGERSAEVAPVPAALKRLPPKPGVRSDVFTLDEGEVILQWPSQMSAESYDDFKAWLDLIAKKAKRTVGMEKTVQCTKCGKTFEVVGGSSSLKEVPRPVLCPYCKEPNEISWPMDAALFSRAIPSQM